MRHNRDPHVSHHVTGIPRRGPARPAAQTTQLEYSLVRSANCMERNLPPCKSRRDWYFIKSISKVRQDWPRLHLQHLIQALTALRPTISDLGCSFAHSAIALLGVRVRSRLFCQGFGSSTVAEAVFSGTTLNSLREPALMIGPRDDAGRPRSVWSEEDAAGRVSGGEPTL